MAERIFDFLAHVVVFVVSFCGFLLLIVWFYAFPAIIIVPALMALAGWAFIRLDV